MNSKHIVLLAMAAVVSANAATYYVDYEHGSDKNAGTREAPYQNVSTAISKTTANQGDTVVLLTGTHKFSAQCGVKAGLTVTGDTGDPKDVIIDCEGKCRAFYMSGSESNVVLSSFTVINGCSYASQQGGGGVRSYVDKGNSRYVHTISNCVFSDCHTLESYSTTYWYQGPYGGALWCQNGGMTVIDTVFTNCVACMGGAVAVDYWRNYSSGYESAPIRMRGCSFYDNLATNGAPNIEMTDAAFGGGAICVVDDWLGATGGDSGDVIPTFYHGLILEDCTFVRNLATNGCGGAISGPIFSAKNCTFLDNRTAESAATTNKNGGAWIVAKTRSENYFALRTSNVLEKCTFKRNYASGAGGAFHFGGQTSFIFKDCTLDANASRGNAPGFMGTTGNAYTYVGFDNCQFVNHTNLNVVGVYGELIGCNSTYNSFDFCLQKATRAEVVDCTFANNYGNGTSILIVGNNTAFDRCVFARNVLGNDPSVAFTTAGEATSGTRTYRVQGVLHNFSYNTFRDISVRNCLFVSNRCERTSGGAIAFCDTNNNEFWIENNTFVGNAAAMRDSVIASEVHFSARPCAVFTVMVNYNGNPNTHINNNLFSGNYDLDDATKVQDIYNSYIKDGSIGSVTYKGTVSNCFFAAAATYPYSGYAVQDGNQGCIVGKNPRFVDAAAGDWRIRKSSKARGAGQLLGWMTTESTDLAGEPRLTGGTVDIGCYQFVQSGLMILFR